MPKKLIANWQKKNYPLSQVMVDSLEGLDVWETVLALGKIRKERRWRKSLIIFL